MSNKILCMYLVMRNRNDILICSWNNPTDYSRDNKKAKSKVGIHDLLKNHFTNSIWKLNPSLQFRYIASFCNINTSVLLKEYKVCTLGMLYQLSIPYCKKTHQRPTDEYDQHMVNILDKAIKNPDQVQAVSEGNKSK